MNKKKESNNDSIVEKTIVKIPKKRGRKPKINKTVENKEVSNEPKKRGRKPKIKSYNIKSKNNIHDIDSMNIILHLPINSKNIIKSSKEDELLTYDPNIKEPIGWQSNKLAGNLIDSVSFINNDEKVKNYSNYPFDKKETDIVNALVDDNSNEIKNSVIDDKIYNKVENKVDNIKVEHDKNWYSANINNENYDKIIIDMKNKRFKELEELSNNNDEINVQSTLIQFKESNKSNSWPNFTSIYCWWCCSPFDNSPCSLPHEYKDHKFYVYGIFCSPECAASYNFDTKSNKIWENYSLLNLLYRKIYNDKHIKIKLAPPREVLKIFGGSLSSSEFRKNNANYNKKYNMIYPPMISIIPQQELTFLDNDYTSQFNKQNIVLKNDNGFILKRSKPFLSSSNPLEKCMNLSLKSD